MGLKSPMDPGMAEQEHLSKTLAKLKEKDKVVQMPPKVFTSGIAYAQRLVRSQAIQCRDLHYHSLAAKLEMAEETLDEARQEATDGDI